MIRRHSASWQGHIRALVTTAMVFGVSYWGSDAISWRPTVVLAPSWLDGNVPIVPFAIWIYVSIVLLVVLALTVPGPVMRTRSVAAMAIACAVAGVIFVAWPTSVPRQEVLPHGITGLAWRLVYSVDTSRNAFPSLHAAFAVVAALALWHSGTGWRVAGLTWAIGVLVAALLVKQHFVLDLLAGLCVGAAAHVLATALLMTQPTGENDQA